MTRLKGITIYILRKEHYSTYHFIILIHLVANPGVQV